MRKISKNLFVALFLLFISNFIHAQLTGTRAIPGDYATITLAVADLNAQGVGAGGVTFDVAAGYTETITARINLTATGTLANPIVFQKSGGGANPIITSYTGGTGTPGSATPDGIWSLAGSDYVTINGIDLVENAANTTNPSTMEYGYGLFKSSLSDGAQNNLITNCTITLNRVNNASATAPMVEGSVGILVINSTPTSAVTALTPTTAAGANSSNRFYSNTIQNCNYGIALSGFAATTPFTAGDTGNDIGGAMISQGNTILNFGGAPAAGNPAAGIRANNQWGVNISYNTLNSNNGGGANHSTTFRGIYAQAGVSANATINNNTITVHSAATTSVLIGIENVIGATAASNTINLNNNIIQNCTYASATTATFTGILNAASAETVNANNNSILNNSIGTSGTASSCTFQGIYSSVSALNFIANNNTISGNTLNNTGGTMYCLRGSTSLLTWNGNTITNNSIPNSGSSTTCSLYGMYNLSSPTQENFANNNINNLSISGSSTSSSSLITGIHMNTSSSSVKNWVNNTIHTFTYNNSSTGSATVTGMSQSLGNTVNIYKNKIYGLTSNGGGSTVNGLTVTSGTTLTIYNNLIGNLSTPTANAADAIRGINFTSTTSTAPYLVAYNTIYINAASTGTNFGSSGIFHTTSSTATTAALNLRNNVIVNLSTPSGTGLTVAYRRSSTTLTNYNSASNNNLFYSGTPGASRLIFYDGTSGDQTLPLYKVRVSPRDALSVTENPPFLSLIGADANFLHINTAIPTQVEAGALPIAGIVDDYDSDSRNADIPDIGADEINGTTADFNPPTIVYTPVTGTCVTSGVTLTATITDASGVPTAGVGLPVLYWKINNAGSFTAVTGVSIGSDQYTFTFANGTAIGDSITYYVAAQDNASTPNVATFPIAGSSGYTSNPPAASTPPSAPNSFFINQTLSGTYTVGAGGNYTTITAAAKAYSSACLTGPVTFSLIDATYPSEIYPIIFNANPQASSTNTLTIKPAIGVSPNITGTAASSYLFRIYSNYVTLDGSNTVGGTTRDLTMTNSSGTNPAVLLIGSIGTNPNTNNVVKNVIMVNGSNAQSCVVVGSSTSTSSSSVNGYNTGFVFQNNSVRNSNYGIYVEMVETDGNGIGFLITGNDMAGVGVNAIRQAGISLINVAEATISNNTIGNLDPATSEVDKGIWLQAGTVNTIVENNTILNLGYTGTASTGNTYGIWVASARTSANIVVRGNTITNLSSSGAATAVGATGIYVSGATTGVTIEKNVIRNVKNTNTTGFGASGIQLTSSSTTAAITVSNNMISDIAAYGKTTAGVVDNGYGIVISSGGGYSVFYNTVHLNTNQTLVGGLPSAINVTSGITTASSVNIRNNIFVNTQTVGTERYSIYSGAASTVFGTINHNDYYTSGPNLGFIGSNRATLTDIQTGFGQNTNSLSILPVFVSSTDLHLAPAANPGLNGVAAPLSITTDIDGDTRNVTTPDVGADEFTPVVGMDVGPFALAAPVSTGCHSAAETVTVTIKNFGVIPIDFSVDNTTVTVIATGGYNSNVVLNSGVLNAGATLNVNLPATINMTANGTYTFNVSTSASGDVNPTNNTLDPVNINVFSFGGTYTVGAAGNYTTLTAAVADYNNATCFTGPVIFSLIDATYSGSETFPISINSNVAAGTNTLTIRPANGVAAKIEGTGSPVLINLGGADYVTIDGLNTGGSSLLLRNISTGGSVIRVISDASNNTFQNLTIEGANTTSTSGLIHLSTGTTTGNDNISILNNTIRDRSDALGVPANLIYSAGSSSTITNTNITVSGNTLKNYTSTAILLSGTGTTNGNENWTISNNQIFQEAARTTAQVGITFTSLGTNTITQNTIRDLNTSSTVTGMNFTDARSTTVSRNRIYNIPSTSGSTSSLIGIQFSGSSGNPASVTIVNNMVSVSPAFANAQAVRGIYDNALSGNTFIANYNSIYIGGTSSGTSSSWALSRNTSTPTAYTARNNIAFNNRSGGTGNHFAAGDQSLGTGTYVSNYNIFVGTGTTAANFMDLGTSSTGTPVSSSTWQAGAPTRDANSQFNIAGGSGFTLAATFVSETDLHAATSSNASNAGTPIATVTDYDNEARDGTSPDVGADEFTAPPGVNMGVTGLIAPTGPCYTANETVTVSIRNYSNTTIDFSINNVTVAVTATGGYNQNVVLTSGTLASGASQNVSMPVGINMTTNGSYTFNANTSVAGDINTLNDGMLPVIRTVAMLSGIYTVGTGGDFGTLTAAITAYNNALCIGSPVEFRLTDLLYGASETFPLQINANAAAGTNTLTIRPAPGVAAVVSAAATTALLNLNGADYIIVDGINSGGASLTLRNTSTTTPTIQFAADASNNIIRNATIEGAVTSSTSGVVFLTDGATTGNDNNSILNNVIRDRSDAAGVPANLIYSNGTGSSETNTNNILSGNTIKNFTTSAIEMSGTGSSNGNENWTITNNQIFQEANRTTALEAITFSSLGTNLISQNVVRDITSSTTTTAIILIDARNTLITRNHIYNLQSTSGSTAAITGITYSGSSSNPASVVISNNMISVVPAFANGQIVRGIYDNALSGNNILIEHNSVYIGGSGTGASSSWAVNRNTLTPTNYTARNNIFFNNRTGGTGSHFAGGDQSPNTGTYSSNNNIYIGTGATAANFMDYGTTSAGTPVSSSTWQAGPPTRDANSQFSNPGVGDYTLAKMFVSTTDLHSVANSPALNSGTPGITGVDFDDQLRSLSTPDIGADEIQLPHEPCGGASFTINAHTTGTTYVWEFNNGSGFVTLTDGPNYTGTNSSTLNLVSIPTSFYGYQYRSVVDGVPGPITTIKIVSYWLGTTNSDWHTASNWSCGTVPDQNTDAMIPVGRPNYPVLNANGVARSVRTANGTSLTINSGFTLDLMGQ